MKTKSVTSALFFLIAFFLVGFQSVGQSVSITVGFDPETSVLTERANPTFAAEVSTTDGVTQQNYLRDITSQSQTFLLSYVEEVWYREVGNDGWFFWARQDLQSCTAGPRYEFKYRGGTASVVLYNNTGETLFWTDNQSTYHQILEGEFVTFRFNSLKSILVNTAIGYCSSFGVDPSQIP